MKKISVITGLLVLICLAGLAIWTSKTMVNLKAVDKQIDSLNTKIEVLEELNAVAELKIDSVENLNKDLTTQVSVREAKIKKLKKEHEKTVTNINNFNTTQLDSFFTSRYGNR
jgi:cell division protein FtsB